MRSRAQEPEPAPTSRPRRRRGGRRKGDRAWRLERRTFEVEPRRALPGLRDRGEGRLAVEPAGEADAARRLLLRIEAVGRDDRRVARQVRDDEARAREARVDVD